MIKIISIDLRIFVSFTTKLILQCHQHWFYEVFRFLVTCSNSHDQSQIVYKRKSQESESLSKKKLSLRWILCLFYPRHFYYARRWRWVSHFMVLPPDKQQIVWILRARLTIGVKQPAIIADAFVHVVRVYFASLSRYDHLVILCAQLNLAKRNVAQLNHKIAITSFSAQTMRIVLIKIEFHFSRSKKKIHWVNHWKNTFIDHPHHHR